MKRSVGKTCRNPSPRPQAAILFILHPSAFCLLLLPLPVIHPQHDHALRPGDYLLRVGGATVPVEVKPRRRAAAPYAGDLLQLAAYCLLVEETTGVAPPYGILRYAQRSWRVPYDTAVRDGVLAALSALGRDARAADVARSHQEPRRCAACALRAACDQRLA